MNLGHLRTLTTGRVEGDPLVKALFALAGDSLVYLAGAAMIGLGNFVLVPLYTRYLAPAEFGVYALVDISALILVTVTQLGFGVSYLKWFAKVGRLRRGELLGSTLTIGALAAIVGGGLLAMAIARPLGEQWLQTTDRGFAWMLLPMVVLENSQGLLLTDLRARRQAIAFSFSAVVRLLTIVGASLWFIVVQDQGIIGIFLGRLAGDGISVLLLTTFCLRSTAPRLAWSIVKPMALYGLPLVWSALIGIMLDASGRYFLSHYSTLEQVGFYSAAIKICNIFQMLVRKPFGVAWGGLMFQIIKWPNARMVYSKILAYVFVLSLAAALILVLFTPTLFAIFATAAYGPAMMVFPWILLVRAINIMEYPTAIGFYLSGRTKWFALIYSVGLGVNLAANYLLVPTYGMFGAAWAWLVAWAIITGLMAWIGQRHYPLHYEWKLLMLALCLWGLVLVVGRHHMSAKMTPGSLLTAAGISLVVLVAVSLFLRRDFRVTRLQAQRDAGDV
jgi:O-antigen/teichoic acid export membrane protein